MAILVSLWILPLREAPAQGRGHSNGVAGTTSQDWVQTNGPTSGLGVFKMDPQDSSVLYGIAREQGLYKSSDGGQSWQLITSLDVPLNPRLEIDPANSSVLYCNSQIMSKSLDGGVTWQPVATGLASDLMVDDFRIDPLDSTILYCIGTSGSAAQMYRTANGGQLWSSSPRHSRFRQTASSDRLRWPETRRSS